MWREFTGNLDLWLIFRNLKICLTLVRYATSLSMVRTNFTAESSSPALDFRNPENFYHDVNSVTGLLKQFFRDLPDPLLTLEYHDSFIAAASEFLLPPVKHQNHAN
jgi:hypothetical protein